MFIIICENLNLLPLVPLSKWPHDGDYIFTPPAERWSFEAECLVSKFILIALDFYMRIKFE